VNQLVTQGIILSRTDYGEADRIITVLTPDHGKLRLMARGVRRAKSKLAGGIELFSVSDLTYTTGRGSLGTLISTRMLKHYGHIVKDLNRVQLGYELIKTLNKATEDNPEDDYFHLLEYSFASLDDATISLDLIRIWFECQLLRLYGHTPNLQTDTDDHKLQPDQTYNFDIEAMAFTPHPSGTYQAQHIKTLRLLFDGHLPAKLQTVQGIAATLSNLQPLIIAMLQQTGTA
jgi:DNA repair protein RecO